MWTRKEIEAYIILDAVWCVEQAAGVSSELARAEHETRACEAGLEVCVRCGAYATELEIKPCVRSLDL